MNPEHQGSILHETPAELRRRLESEPLPPNLGAQLDAAGERFCADPAWIWIERAARPVTYREISELADRSANAFTMRGVKRGDHVGVGLPASPEYLAIWYGLGKIGATLIPLNPKLTVSELEHLLSDAKVQYLLITADMYHHVAATATGRKICDTGAAVLSGSNRKESWEDLLRSVPAHFEGIEQIGLDEVSTIIYTSGSTGRPKGCIHTHRYWLTLGKVKSAITLPAKRILSELPFYYMSPYYRFSTATYRGAAICVPPAPSLVKFYERIKTYRLELVWANDPIASLPPPPPGYTSHLKQVSLYGLKKNLHRPLEEKLGVPAREDFGMTEVGAALYMPVEDAQMTGSGSCGIPAPFRRCMIANEQGQELPNGNTGELLIKGPGIFSGYQNHPEATVNAFFGEWFRTGDLARRDENGYFYIVGRIKEMIRRSAENISAQEVEATLYAIPGIAEVAVIGVPDDLRGEEVKACIVLQPGVTQQDLPPHTILEKCRASLAAFKVPRYVQFYVSLPKTSSEKVAKKIIADGGGETSSRLYDANEAA